MKSAAVIIVLGLCNCGLPAGTQVSPLEDPSASDVQALDTRRDVMVYLATQANLTVAGVSKEERGTQVQARLVAHAEATQAPIVAMLAGLDYQLFYVTNAILVRNATTKLIAQLEARSDVARVRSDGEVALVLPPKSNVTEFTQDRGIEKSLIATGADVVWSQLRVLGAGVVVAGQDTGVDWTHPALKAKYRGWNGTAADHAYNWHDAIHGSGSNPCGYSSAEPCDDDEHGTHTMGTVLGDDGAGNQVGMAPDAKWIACRNMDRGRGKPSTYIECFEWFLAPYPQGGDPRKDGDPSKAPDVINNSWGCDGSEGCSGDEILPAMAALHAAGVTIVASAGNDGPSCSTISTQPATDSAHTLTVGAYDYRNDKIARFSSRGPSTLDGQVGPQVAAPGVGIRSCIPGGGYAGGWDGTSMAGPHVAGEVALLVSAKPQLKGKPDAIMQAIRSSARAMTSAQTCGGLAGSALPNNTWGYGTIDALKAINSVP